MAEDEEEVALRRLGLQRKAEAAERAARNGGKYNLDVSALGSWVDPRAQICRRALLLFLGCARRRCCCTHKLYPAPSDGMRLFFFHALTGGQAAGGAAGRGGGDGGGGRGGAATGPRPGHSVPQAQDDEGPASQVRQQEGKQVRGHAGCWPCHGWRRPCWGRVGLLASACPACHLRARPPHCVCFPAARTLGHKARRPAFT